MNEESLKVLNEATGILYSSATDVPFQTFLDILAPALSADRIYIFLNHLPYAKRFKQ